MVPIRLSVCALWQEQSPDREWNFGCRFSRQGWAPTLGRVAVSLRGRRQIGVIPRRFARSPSGDGSYRLRRAPIETLHWETAPIRPRRTSIETPHLGEMARPGERMSGAGCTVLMLGVVPSESCPPATLSSATLHGRSGPPGLLPSRDISTSMYVTPVRDMLAARSPSGDGSYRRDRHRRVETAPTRGIDIVEWRRLLPKTSAISRGRTTPRPPRRGACWLCRRSVFP